jgi:Zn-finger protein
MTIAKTNTLARASCTVPALVGLWCPDCDRETPHDVSGAPVAECRDCLEPHEMTAAEIIKANAGHQILSEAK